MPTKDQPQRRPQAHVGRIVLTLRCSGCGRWIVFRMQAAQASTFDDEAKALAYAETLRDDPPPDAGLTPVQVYCPAASPAGPTRPAAPAWQRP